MDLSERLPANAVSQIVESISVMESSPAVDSNIRSSVASEVIGTTVISAQQTNANHSTNLRTTAKTIDSGDHTANCIVVERSNQIPNVPSKSNLRLTSRRSPWGERAVKAARTTNKSYRSYGKLKGWKDKANAFASTFNGDPAEYDANDSIWEPDNDAGLHSDVSISRDLNKDNVNTEKIGPYSKADYNLSSLGRDVVSNGDSGGDDNSSDTNATSKQRQEISQRTFQPSPPSSEDKFGYQKFDIPHTSNEKATNKRLGRETIEVIEQEIEDDEYVSDGHDVEERQQSPQKPARMLVSRARSLGRILSWIIMILVPLLFVAAGVMTIVVTNKPSDNYMGAVVQQANSIAASIWPIAFAAIVAQSLRAFASFQAERGLKLMTLEQLINSHSLASALKLPFVLRRLNFIAIGLVFLWALSPLAGQATLRMLTVNWIGQTENGSAIYLNTTQDPYVFRNPGNWRSQVDVLYMYSLIEPTSATNAIGNKSTDPWSNPRIPVLSTFTKQTDDGPHGVDSKPPHQPHYSLLGIPIGNISGANFIANMTITSAYFTLQCSPFQEVNISVLYDPLSSNTTYFNSSYSAFNLGLINTTDASAASLGYVDSIRLVSSHVNPSYGLSYESTTYKLNRTFITSRISGNTTAWAVTDVQETVHPNSPPLDSKAFASCLQHLAANDAPSSAISNTITQRYLLGGSNLSAAAGPNDAGLLHSLSSIGLNTFTERFALVLNTYWHAGFSPSSQTSNVTYFENITFSPATAVVRTDTTQVFRPNIPWLVVLFASAGILLVAGIACAIWDAHTIGPDVFGFANALLRNGKYIKLPKGVDNAAMSGPERARLLADMEVMLQDVSPGSDVGRIVLGTKSAGAGGEARLKIGRMYR